MAPRGACGNRLPDFTWVSREGRLRWTIPTAVVAVWIALALANAIYHIGIEGRMLKFLPTLVVIVGAFRSSERS